MAIAYESKPLPAVSTFPFDISAWQGVNKIKGSQADGEMADCKNMGSGNFPYASPRKPREKLIDEAGIKRIYKVEDDRVYYIDSENHLCYCENGVKAYVGDEKIQIKETTTTNNYDEFTIFYPSIQYIDADHKLGSAKNRVLFGDIANYVTIDTDDEFGDEIGEYTTDKMMQETYTSYIFDVKDLNASDVKITAKFPEAKEYKFPEITGSSDSAAMKLVLRIYDKDGNTRKYTDENDVEHVIIKGIVKITGRENEYVLNIPENIEFQKGDYCLLRLGYFYDSGARRTEWEANLNYALRAEWNIEQTDNSYAIAGPVLDYGVVYNNRIVGVSGSEIRASALGDFTNFWEYADEAGNPSATGAYATDVGSAGDFTGICAYNNVLLLFKKNIVYEMYGSMPYTISELCTTGCIDNDSIVSIDGVLYWVSPKGVVRYSGGVPQVISTQLDINTDSVAKAGTDGRKYYVYDGFKTYVYDTYYRMWHIEDDKNVKMRFNHINDLYCVYDDGIYKLNSGNEAVEWEFETKDFTFQSAERKNLSKLWIRADMPKQSRLEVYARQDGNKWQRVAVKTAERDEMFDFKLRIKKCDSFALKFKGKGDVHILDIHGKVTVGTSKHRSGMSLNVYRK